MKYFHQIIFTAILIMTFTSGCRKAVSINEKQAILFQIDYLNYAWGYEHSGILITNEGKILTYKNPEKWNYPDEDLNISESQMLEDISFCTDSKIKIPDDELVKYAGHINNIASSKVTALKNVATDAGTRQYICYKFSSEKGIYKGYIIKMEGNFTCENLNFYSKKVSIWLKTQGDITKRTK